MKLALLSTEAGAKLAQKIGQVLDLKPLAVNHKRFADAEYVPQILENIRGTHLTLIAPISPPSDHNLMDTVILGDAIARANTEKFTIVIPYLAYNRQDRKDRPRVPLTAKLVADIISLVEPDNILFFDVHSEATIGFLPTKIDKDHLYGSAVAVNRLSELVPEPFVIASPDEGGGKRAGVYAGLMGQTIPLVKFDKKRRPDGTIDPSQSQVIGDVRGKNVILIDDMLDTGGTANTAAQTAIDNGALAVYFFATHGLLSGNAAEKLNAGPMTKILITDSIDHDQSQLGEKIEEISIAPLLAEAIRRIHEGESISELIKH